MHAPPPLTRSSIDALRNVTSFKTSDHR